MQVYDEMVVGEASILGPIPKDWKNTRIFSFAKERKEFATDEANELLSISEYFGVAPRNEKFTESEGGSRDGSTIGYRIVKKDDLAMNYMLAWKGAQGVSKYNGIVSPAYAVYQLNTSVASPGFIHHLFRSKLYQTYFKSLSRGIMDSRLRLYPETFLHLSINIPSKKRQQKIADFLDAEIAKIDTLIAKQERLLELLEEKRRATIIHAVTHGLNQKVDLKETNIPWIGQIPTHWQYGKVYQYCSTGSGTTPNANLGSWYTDDENAMAWVTTSELRENIITTTKLKVTQEAVNKHSALKIYKPGTLLIAMYGATIGRLGTLGVEAVTNQACCALRPNHRILTQYLYYYLLAYRNQLLLLSNGGGQPNISKEKVDSFSLIVPVIKDQQIIVKYLDDQELRVEALKQKIQTQISLLRERQTSLISHAVTGKIKI